MNNLFELYEEFSPKGLTKWKETRSDKYNDEAGKLLHDIRLEIKKRAFEVLRREYGVQRWWNDGVPKNVQQKCAKEAINEGQVEPDHNYMYLLGYHDIIDKESKLLIDLLTMPGEQQSSKSDKLKWLRRLSAIRNRTAHPEREPATEEDRDYVKSVHNWLCSGV